MSPVPIPLALGRAASSRAAMHPATGLAGDRWATGMARRIVSERRIGPAYGVVSRFSLPPGLVHSTDDGLPAFVNVRMLNDKARVGGHMMQGSVCGHKMRERWRYPLAET